MLQFVFASFRKDLLRWRDDPTAFLIWLGIPFLVGSLLMAMAGDSGSPGPSGTLLIADEDDTLLSGFVAGAFSQGELQDMIAVQTVYAEQGLALVEAGEASAFLRIPAGFQDAFLDDQPIILTLKTNPSQTVLPGIIENVMDVLLDAGFYAQALLGDELKQIQAGDAPETPSDLFVSDIAVQINQKMVAIGPLAFPPAFDLSIVEPPATEPAADLGLLFLPGLAMMALLFSAQGLAADFWQEREQGTLRRLVSSSGSILQFILGKALAATLVISAICAVTLLAGFAYKGIEMQKLLPSLLWLALAGGAFFAWFAALQTVFPTRRAASLLTTIFLFPLLMIGGSFFPLDALPDWLAEIGRLSPNGYVVDKLTTELTSSASWSFGASGWVVVLLMLSSGVLLCAWRLRSEFARAA